MTDSFDDWYGGNPHMFGHPYQELQDYFRSHKKGSLLDLGSGQGRDSLFLASIGYQVTAIDTSKVGVDQMLSKAESSGLKIEGIVGDVLNVDLVSKYDVILFDMLLHSFKNAQQSEILEKYTKHLNTGGIFCIVFPDDVKSSHFMRLLKPKSKWDLLDEIVVKDVPKIEVDDGDYEFKMIIVQHI